MIGREEEERENEKRQISIMTREEREGKKGRNK